MASRALLRNRKCLVDSVKRTPSVALGFLGSERGSFSGTADKSHWGSVLSHSSSGSQRRDEECAQRVPKGVGRLDLRKYSAYGFSRVPTLHYGVLNSKADYMLYLSTATAGQPQLRGDEDKNEEPVVKQKKEASPEECDQAVEGLSTAKAKAKAKKLQETKKGVSFVLKRMWAMILGIGPALRAVASMSSLSPSCMRHCYTVILRLKFCRSFPDFHAAALLLHPTPTKVLETKQILVLHNKLEV